MSLSFGNPSGFWALTGLAAVVAIHFLQRRSQQVPCTTLFLLENHRKESETGSRFERLRTSWPFWLQLLMVLGLTWLLVQPRWLRKDSVQRLAVVLDASASMAAAKDAALKALEPKLAQWGSATGSVEYFLLTSDPESSALYHGASERDFRTALSQAWQPRLGGHDFVPALRTARSLVGETGVIVWVSDHPPVKDLPFRAKSLAVGSPLGNCGWAGLTMTDEGTLTGAEVSGTSLWRATVRNYGNLPEQRSWWVEAGEQKSPPQTLNLAPGETRSLQGPLPPGAEGAALVLSSDALPIDDRLPLVKPLPKPLLLSLPAASDPDGRELREMFTSFAHTRLVDDPQQADLVAGVYSPLNPSLPGQNACLFAEDPQPGASYVTGQIVAEADPLLTGVNWQSLLVRETLGVPKSKDDRVILWQGERPLIALRTTPQAKKQLLFNFDIHTSNARRLPAFAVLLHRFLEMIREEKIAPSAENTETGQRLKLAHQITANSDGQAPPPLELQWTESDEKGRPQSRSKSFPISQAQLLRAPSLPGPFLVKQGNLTLFTSAAHFADPRESDLSQAATKDETGSLVGSLVERHSMADAHWRLWAGLLLGVLLLSWWLGERKPIDKIKIAAV